MTEEVLTYHIPVNLRRNLEEAVDETASGVDVLFQDHQWTISADEKVLGWITFEKDSSYFNIELISASLANAGTLHQWFQDVVSVLNEEIGSDQCKTGRCSL